MLFNALDYRPRRRIHLLITREYPRFTVFSKGSEKILWRKSHSRKFSCIVSPFSVGLVAQLVEQRIENPCVRGSIPRKATKRFKRLRQSARVGVLHLVAIERKRQCQASPLPPSRPSSPETAGRPSEAASQPGPCPTNPHTSMCSCPCGHRSILRAAVPWTCLDCPPSPMRQ